MLNTSNNISFNGILTNHYGKQRVTTPEQDEKVLDSWIKVASELPADKFDETHEGSYGIKAGNMSVCFLDFAQDRTSPDSGYREVIILPSNTKATLNIKEGDFKKTPGLLDKFNTLSDIIRSKIDRLQQKSDEEKAKDREEELNQFMP